MESNQKIDERARLDKLASTAYENYKGAWYDYGDSKKKAWLEAEQNLKDHIRKNPTTLEAVSALGSCFLGLGGDAQVKSAIKNASLSAAVGAAYLLKGGADLATGGVVAGLGMGADAVSSSISAIGSGLQASAGLISGLFSKKPVFPQDNGESASQKNDEEIEPKKSKFEIIYEKGADTRAGDHITFALKESTPGWSATKTNLVSAATHTIDMSLSAFEFLCQNADCSKEMPVLSQDPFESALAGAGSE